MDGLVTDTGVDHYTASIEFSNACREFYMNRIKATDSLKQKIQKSETEEISKKSQQPKSSIQCSMDRLRKEMASLMDQDLSLMKQLLTLNETIEDIKNKRMYGVSKDSLRDSMDKLSISDWSVSETDLYSSQEDINDKTIPQSSNFLTVPGSYRNFYRSGSKQDNTLTEVELVVPNDNCYHQGKKIIHGAQYSIDSGYDETDFYQPDMEVAF